MGLAVAGVKNMKLNRQNTKKRRPNNFPEVRRNKGQINRRYSYTPKKKQSKIARIRKPTRRKRFIKTYNYRRQPKRRIKIILAILLAILVLLLGLIK